MKFHLKPHVRDALLLGAIGMGVLIAGETVLHTPTTTPPPVRHTMSCDTDEECAKLPACALKPGCDGSPATEPFRLVGYGCDGGRIVVPIYRDEEDEFPGPCVAIEGTMP